MHLVPSSDTELPTSVCIVRVSPRGGGSTVIRVAVAADVEGDAADTGRSYAEAEEVLAVVAEFLRDSGAAFRTHGLADHDE